MQTTRQKTNLDGHSRGREGSSRGSEKHMLRMAAMDAVEAFPFKLTALLSPLDTLIDGLKALVADLGKPGEGSELLIKSEGDGLRVEDYNAMPAGQGIGGIAATYPPQTNRLLLQQSPPQQQCGATLSLQNASLASIVSASPSVSSCSSVAVSPEAQQMALILGAVDSINQATLDMQVAARCARGSNPP